MGPHCDRCGTGTQQAGIVYNNKGERALNCFGNFYLRINSPCSPSPGHVLFSVPSVSAIQRPCVAESEQGQMAFQAPACHVCTVCACALLQPGTLCPACRSYVGHPPNPQSSENVYSSDKRPAVSEGTISPSYQHRICHIRDKEKTLMVAVLKWL